MTRMPGINVSEMLRTQPNSYFTIHWLLGIQFPPRPAPCPHALYATYLSGVRINVTHGIFSWLLSLSYNRQCEWESPPPEWVMVAIGKGPLLVWRRGLALRNVTVDREARKEGFQMRGCMLCNVPDQMAVTTALSDHFFFLTSTEWVVSVSDLLYYFFNIISTWVMPKSGTK